MEKKTKPLSPAFGDSDVLLTVIEVLQLETESTSKTFCGLIVQTHTTCALAQPSTS